MGCRRFGARFTAANQTSLGGILAAPGNISEEDTERIKAHWEQKFSRRNIGRVAVVGSGLKYEKLGFSAEDSELLASRRFSAEEIARLFSLPPPLVGIWDNST